jgi:primary-amine oxidase
MQDIATRSVAKDQHPLDGLSSAEIAHAAACVRAAHDLGSGMRFETIVLDEPEPDELTAHEAGKAIERRAFVATYDMATGALYEAVVSLTRAKVLSWTARPGAKPRIGPDDFLLAEDIIMKDERFLAALRKRGITDMSMVCVDPWSTGSFGIPGEREKRLIQSFAWVRAKPFDNQFAHPIEGLSAIIDINAGEVVSVDDFGPWTIGMTDGNYGARFQKAWRRDLKPIDIVQPEGPSFTVTGNLVEWGGWRFRVGFTPREGLVLYDLKLRQGEGDWRSLIRRAAVAEMIVPYGAPHGVHPRKNAFDCGEYGIGALANSLTLGCDCLGAIHYFDAVLNTTAGGAMTIPNAVCLHEEDAGLLWKHTDFRTQEADTRRARRLVVSFISTVGNYEYAFYWNLHLDGTLTLEVKLTGIINTAGSDPARDAGYSTEVQPDVFGQIHQHLFCARIDMAVDGPDNTVVEVNTVLDEPGPNNPHNNAFHAVETLLLTEKQARRRAEPKSHRFWKIVNRGKTNQFGRFRAYKLVAHSAIAELGGKGSQLDLRAGFTRNHVWVTPTSKDERWPAGDYVNQSEADEGLPRWTEADRSVADRPVTLWHVFGHHHIVRPEDFPVQSAVTCGFMLQPHGFFDRNPTLDVPPTEKRHSCCV